MLKQGGKMENYQNVLMYKLAMHIINLDLSEFNMFSALKIAIITSSYGLTQNIKSKYEKKLLNK